MPSIPLNRSVLIVDNDTTRRHAIYEVLKNQEIGLVSAANSREAMVLVRSEKPAVIVVNMSSPTVEGMEFVRDLRNYGMGQLIHIIGYVTSLDEETKKALAAGADSVVDDAVPMERVARMVNSQLARIK